MRRLAQRRQPVAEPWSIHPSRGSIGEGESALSVNAIAGHLPTPRRWGTRVCRAGLFMTKHGSFKKVVRRHARATGQRYTEALTDLEGLDDRMIHEPSLERLLTHFRDHYRIDATAATRISVHKTYVFRIDRADGDPWIARAFPPLAQGPTSRAMSPSCGSWSGTTSPRSAWPSTTRCRTSTEARSSSPGSSRTGRSPRLAKSWA